MPDITFSCFQCGQSVRLLSGQKVLKSDTCTKCSADLHCCRNCRFFDPGRNNQCSEPQAELVTDKVRANFCDYFEARTSIDLVRRTQAGPDETRKRFDSLFKK